MGFQGKSSIDHLVAELEIAAFAADFGAEQDIRLPSEVLYLAVFFGIVHPAVKQGVGDLLPIQVIGKVLQRF